MKNIFYKIAGTVLSASIIFTGLSTTAAFAEGPEPNPVNNEETTEEAVYANIESIEIIDENNISATIEVKLDKNIEDTDMPLFLYEKNNPESINEFSEGGKTIHFDVDKTDKVKEYYAVTGSSTSNTVILNHKIDNIPTFELTSNTTILETDAYRPELSWDITSEQKREGKIFIVDSYGTIVQTETTYSDYTIDYFHKEKSMSYTAYIANDDYYSKTLSDLKNIKYMSNTITIYKEEWNIDVTINFEEHTSEDKLYVSVKSNGLPNGYYDMYLVEENSGTIIDNIYFGDSDKQPKDNYTTDLWVDSSHTEKETKYTVYVAKDIHGIIGENKDKLQEIQYKSKTVSTQHTPFDLNISTSRNTFYTFDNTPIIYWNLNQKLLKSPYSVFVVNEETGEIRYRNSVDDFGEFEIDHFWYGEPQSYKVYVAQTNSSYPQTKHKSQLTDIVEESELLTFSRGEWKVTAAIVPNGAYNKIIWSTNQPNNRENFSLYLIDKNDGKIIYTERQPIEGEIDKLQDDRNFWHDQLFAGDYKLVIGETHYWDDEPSTPKYYSELKKIEAEVDVTNKISANNWYLSLDYGSIQGTNNQIRFNIATNKYTYKENKAVYIIRESDQKIIKSFYTRDTRHFEYDYKINNNNSEIYKAYIADNNTKAKKYSDLKNIVADSDSIYPKFVPSTGEYKPNGGRFGGGFNPSSPNCQQQCYGDPVNNYTGEYFENTEDLNVGSAYPISFTRSYSTFKKDEIGTFGLGSRNNYEMSLIGEFDSLEDSNNVRIIQENGSIINFIKGIDGTFISDANTQAELYRADNTYIMKRNSGEKFIFNQYGKLIKTSDIFNNENSLQYDKDNKLVKIVSENNQYIQINYKNNLIISITDGSRTVSYSYDTDNRLIKIKPYNTKNEKEYSYDSNNRVIKITQPNGGEYKNSYDDNNRVVKQIDPLGGETLFNYQEYYNKYKSTITLPNQSEKIDTYDKYGKLLSETFDSNGEDKNFEYEYTVTGNVSKTIDADNKKTRYIYDSKGNIITIIDDLGRSTRFTYNEKNQVIERINPYGKKFINTYNENGILINTNDENNNITKYSTDEKGRLIATTKPEEINKNDPKSEKIVYDNNGFISQNIMPEGGTQQTINNSIGQPIELKDALGNSTTIEYDNHFNIIQKTYSNGTFEKYEYDNAGRMILFIDVLGNKTSYSYDTMDNIVSSTDVFGTSQYKYDSHQNLTQITSPNNQKTYYTYNALDQLISTKNAEGNLSTIKYNNAGNIASETDFKGNVTSYGYDDIGNVTRITNADNERTLYSYDQLNRLTKIEYPNEYTELYKYDNVGNILEKNRNNKDITKYLYDKNNQLVKTTYSDKSTEEITHNSNGLITNFLNRDKQNTSYKYNANNQVVETIRPDKSVESIKYNSMGDLQAISYDNWASIDTEYVYTDIGQLSKTIKDGNEETYSYDSIGQLTSRGPPSQQVGYSYNDYGQLSEIKYPSGSNVKYTYNNLNNIDKVLLNNNKTIVEYSYDENSNVTQEKYGNNTEKLHNFDSLNRLTNIVINNKDESLYDRSLSYDETYLITNSTTSINGELTEDKDISYSSLQKLSKTVENIDKTTNKYLINSSSQIIESPFSTNNLSSNGQLIKSSSNETDYSYEYDSRGNRVSKSKSIDNSNVDYSWSNNNKLENITINNFGSSSVSIDYTYDTSGLLKSRSKDNVKTDNYVWDTSSVIPLLLEDGNNSYIYGNNSSPIAQINKNTDEIHYLHSDERNSVVLATDKDGNATLTREFDEYGQILDEQYISAPGAVSDDSGEQQSNNEQPVEEFYTNFAYAGEYKDSDTNLYNLRARWYEPSTGTFINQDPALMATGEAYTYASGNPLSFTDPLGLYSVGTIPNDSTGGNIAAGFVDGLIGFPVVGKISNYVKPGSVNICGPGYVYSGYAGNISGFVIPGGAAVKGTTMALKGTGKGVAAVGKINKAEKTDESVKIYRGVGLEEHYDIIKTGKFRIDGKTNYETGKFYFSDPKQAEAFADRYKDIVSIHQADIPKQIWQRNNSTVLSGVESSGRFVEKNDLLYINNVSQYM